MKRSVISLSGGLDSTCLLLNLLSDNHIVTAYGFKYGQNHSNELEAASDIVKYLKEELGYPVTFQVINLESVFSDSTSCLCGGNIPKGCYDENGMKSTVVENRNVIFSSIIYGKALSISKKENCDVGIYLGVHSGDHSLYPDTTAISVTACSYAFNISNWGSEKIKYYTPFVNIDKNEVLKHGLYAMHNMGLSENEQNKILGMTHSCYEPDQWGRSCGKCGTCIERLNAFAFNNIKDPAIYQD